jgi:ATP-dependent exoDNAse (exonuclease V) alpha subunit
LHDHSTAKAVWKTSHPSINKISLLYEFRMSKKTSLNADQKSAFKAIQRFLDSAADTFVLRGYAGTGKTFLMQYLGQWLKEQKHPFKLLASTGRAATVLRGKTGFTAKTVHSELYNFSSMDGMDDIPDDSPMDAYGQMRMQFQLREPDDEKTLYIVDEASMLTSELSSDMSFASFGSGFLLTDFFAAVGKNKIIFVGDPCQLPPVGEITSPALDMNWLALEKRIAVSFTLEKIERTKGDNDILVLSEKIRNMSLQEDLPKFPKLPAKGMKNVKLHDSDKHLFNAYLEKYKKKGVNGALAIARSNKMVRNINRAVRRDLYGELDPPLRTGDVLLVIQNNNAVPLVNGDFVTVISLGPTQQQAGLNFQEVKIKAFTSDEELDMLVSLDILYGEEVNFSHEQSRALMIDFKNRMSRDNVRPNSEEFRNEMRKDPFLNCLRAKYGYAVTCHKSQGGEWDHVYLFLEKSMYSMEKPELCKWWYTAVTRARKELNLVDEWWISE